MKSEVRAGMGWAARFDPAWWLFRRLKQVADVLAEPYHQGVIARRRRDDAAVVRALSPQLRVLNGPFRGLHYAEAAAAGSVIVPKLLGSYEHELHGALLRLMASSYSDIVDIGCAEGYYAVGLGRHFEHARIHAFDSDSRARRLCRQMAWLNGVAGRMTLSGRCDEPTLLALLTRMVGARVLLVCDCEGFEAALFSERVVAQLAPHDLVIEVHERLHPELAAILRRRFEASHEVLAIDSTDDGRRLRQRLWFELAAYDAPTRRRLLSEGREGLMEWLVLTARRPAGPVATPRADAAMTL